MIINLILKEGNYFMLTDLISPLDFKQILKGRLLSQKKNKKYGVIFSYEFDDGFKFSKKRGRKPKLSEPESPESDDVEKESPDQDEEYEEEIDPKRHDTFNADEDDMSDLDDDTERNDDPDNKPDKDLEPVKKFDTNSKAKELKKKLNKAKKIIKKTRPKLEETDSPDTSTHTEEQDDDEDNKKDPEVNPGRITAQKIKDNAVQARRVKFQAEKRPNLFKDDLTIGRQLLLSKKAKKRIKPRTVPDRAYSTTYEYVEVRCASCGNKCKITRYEADATLAGKGRRYDPRNDVDNGKSNFIPNAAYRCPGCERGFTRR